MNFNKNIFLLYLFILIIYSSSCFVIGPSLKVSQIKINSLKKKNQTFLKENNNFSEDRLLTSKSLVFFKPKEMRENSLHSQFFAEVIDSLLTNYLSDKNNLIILIDLPFNFEQNHWFSFNRDINSKLSQLLFLKENVFILEVCMFGDSLKEFISVPSERFYSFEKRDFSFMNEEKNENFVHSIMEKLQPEHVFFWGSNTSVCVYHSLNDFFKNFPQQKTFFSFFLSDSASNFELSFLKDNFTTKFYLEAFRSKKIIPFDLSLFNCIDQQKEEGLQKFQLKTFSEIESLLLKRPQYNFNNIYRTFV